MLLWLALCLQEAYVAGPPFLPFGEEAELSVEGLPADVSPVWRLLDAPGGIVAALEVTPACSRNDFTIRAPKIRLRSVGKTEGDVRLSISLERRGARLSTLSAVVRIGAVLRLPVHFRPIRHDRGGVKGFSRKKEFADECNRVWKACGIQFDFEEGEPVEGRDRWFDEHGRFHPIVFRGNVRQRSAVLDELVEHRGKRRIDLFVVRDCHMTNKGTGLGNKTIDYPLSGWGYQEEAAGFDESAAGVDVAHEIGHVLGLGDLGPNAWSESEVPPAERRRLMCTVRKFRTATGFTSEEMKLARETAARIVRGR